MMVLIGIVVVFGSVMAGFLMAGGKPLVLFQPNEYVVIGGAAIGAVLIGTPLGVLSQLLRQLGQIPRAAKGPKDYLELLMMGYEILTLSRRDGHLALEAHVQDPAASAILGKYPGFLADVRALTFFTDTVNLITLGTAVDGHAFDSLLESDIEVQHGEASKPANVLRGMGDALPGLGIVAAVLGIVITMGHIDGPPSEIGHHVGAALVGTFLGVLLAYGFVGPVAQHLSSRVDAHRDYLVALKGLLVSLHQGQQPTLAVELARRSLPNEVRPSAADLTEACRSLKGKPPGTP
jgi:chemotaxis protein MotA